MTTLAGRTSSIKNSDNTKKSAELRFTLLKLPSTKVFVNEPNDSEVNQALQTFKNEYSTAKLIDQQLSVINQLFGHFTSSSPWILNERILCQMLTDLYFNAPLKHPLRSILAKALNKESTKKGALIIESLALTIIECNCRCLELLQQDEYNTEAISVFVASLYGSFINFSAAVAAIESCFQLLLKSFHQFIATFMKMLQNKNSLSPARRSEVFIDLHNTIRIVLSGVQRFPKQLIDSSVLEPIISQCWLELLDNPVYADAPIDTKINCGVLKVNYDRLFGDIFAPAQNILHQFESDKNSTMSVQPKATFYTIAIINTLTETDFKDKNVYVALQVLVNCLISIGNMFTIDACLIMAVTRSLVQYTKRLLTLLRKVSIENDQYQTYLQVTVHDCLGFVWMNVHHSVDCVRYLSKDLLKNLLRLGFEQPKLFDKTVSEIINIAKSDSTSESLVCLLLDFLSQVFTTEYVLSEMPNIQQTILNNLFKDSCWAICYEQLMSKNAGIDYELWCKRWIQPLLCVDANEWKNDFDRLKIIRNLFERALKTKPEAAEYILADPNISIEIYLFVLWIMRRSGRKLYAPENYRASADSKVIYAKVHPSDEIRILAFRILIECHKVSSQFPVEDFHEILEFFKFNCNVQNPSMRQQINTTMRHAMTRLECGYLTAKRTPAEYNTTLCCTYETFLKNLIEFCVNWCLFDGSNFGRRTIGLSTLYLTMKTWQTIQPDNTSIYTDKLWIRLQKSLSDSYAVNKDIATDILMLCWKFYSKKSDMIYSLDDLKKFVTTFRPYDTMTAAQYIVFCSFSETYFKNYYDAVLWCEALLNDGLVVVQNSLLQFARYNALYGLILSIRQLLKRIDFSIISELSEIENWRSFFQRMIPKCKELTDVAAPVVNSSAPEGHLPNDLNDVSHYLSTGEATGGIQIKVTSQMILLCAWRTVREAALLLGEIALHIPLLTASNPNGFVSIDQLLFIGAHFQQLLVEIKHRGAFEQSFLGFSNLCLRLWRSHESKLHSYPMKLVEKIAKIIAGECSSDASDAELDVKKLCITRRSAGIPFMVQGIVTTEAQVCSLTTLNFCMTTFLNIAKTGPVSECRTHSLNVLRMLFRCAELGEAVSEYISDGIECSIRGYSAASWPERNSSTLLFSALMIRVFGVQRTKISENLSIKNKMTGRLFFIRYPRLYEFFYVELKSASEAIERNERPPRLHPLLLLISRLYPSAREMDSNFKLSTYIPFISICSSSPELVTRQLSAKSIVALLPLVNVTERLSFILENINAKTSINAIHGYLLQALYLLQSTKEQSYEIDIQTLKEFTMKFMQLPLPVNNIIGKTYLEILLEILSIDRFHPFDSTVKNQLIEIRDKFLNNFALPNHNQLTQSYIQKSFTLFNILVSTIIGNELSIISSKVTTTQYELVKTQLNLMYLLLCQSSKKKLSAHDFSYYEIELVKFFSRNHTNNSIIFQLLPSVNDLYDIIDYKRREFYPFGVIKAYEILSMFIAPTKAFEKNSQLKRLTIDQIMDVMNATCNEEGVDDVAESMWKFIMAHLCHCSIKPSHITTEQIKTIILHLRNSTQSYKLSGLRQAVTEILSKLIKYFVECIDLDIIIEFTELLLCLLRDDDLYVRNRTAEIVMDLIHTDATSFEKVIPLAAEDYLLQWLDLKFIELAKEDAWSKWLTILRFIHPAMENGENNIKRDNEEDSHLIDVDIFDDTESNTFDETIYISYKCYTFLLKHINDVALDSVRKDAILSEFIALQNI